MLAHPLGHSCPSLWSVNELREQVVREAEPLASVFAEAGRSLYLVGGIVRDLHLDMPLDALDFDLTTEARPDEIKRLVDPLSDAVWTQGEKFGTIGFQMNGRPYEITTHRAESYNDDSRKPEVQFGDDIEVDLSRRDFTVNAMAIDLVSGELFDPFGGETALADRVLRTPIEPEVSFSDDPLRILRAARFIARYDLVVDADVTTAAKSLIDRMSIVSKERIRDELDKLLAAPRPSSGLAFLAEVGAWSYVSSAIDASELPLIGEQLDRSDIDNTLRRAVVFSHCSAADRADQLNHLKYSNSESRQLRLILAGLDLVTQAEEDFQAPTVRRMVARVKYDSMATLLELLTTLEVPDRGLTGLFNELDAAEGLTDLSPELTGEDIMDLLAIEPGPEVGAALSVLQERRFNDGPIDRAAEIEFLFTTYKRR